MKRIVLFLVTNLAVMLVLGLAVHLLGLNRFITAQGLNLGQLLGFALIMGFGGAIISLLISKPMAKWTAGLRMIDNPQNADEAWIVATVAAGYAHLKSEEEVWKEFAEEFGL